MPDHTPEIDDVYELVATEKVRRLKFHYWRAIDQYIPDDMAVIFAQDAVIDFLTYGTLSGRDAIVDFYRTQVYPAYDMMVHHGANPEIDILSTTEAQGIWQYEAWMLGKDGIGYWHCGWYEDRYVLEEGAWRIAYTKGQHHFNIRVEDQWAKARFENDDWPPTPSEG